MLLQFCVSGLKTSNYGNIHEHKFCYSSLVNVVVRAVHIYILKKKKRRIKDVAAGAKVNFVSNKSILSFLSLIDFFFFFTKSSKLNFAHSCTCTVNEMYCITGC